MITDNDYRASRSTASVTVGGPKDLSRDMQRGVKFYMAAAEAGHPQANFNLGALYHGLADVIEHPMLPLRPLGLLLKHEYPLASSWDHRGLKGADKSLITARSSALGPSRHGGNAQTGSASDQVHDQKKNSYDRSAGHFSNSERHAASKLHHTIIYENLTDMNRSRRRSSAV